MDLIKTIEETQRRPGAQDFHVGDTGKVFFKIIEEKKTIHLGGFTGKWVLLFLNELDTIDNTYFRWLKLLYFNP